MFVIIECYQYHFGRIKSLMDEHTFCITVLEPLTFNLDNRFFRQNVTLPVLVSYAHSLPVVFSGRNKLECLND